ncbi:MAG: cytochrome c oxidase subunit II [Chloroflexota bacterium]
MTHRLQMSSSAMARALRRSLLVLAASAMALLNGCAADVPQTTISPKTEAAWMIQDLYVPTFWISVVVFVLVEVGLLAIIAKYRYREGAPLPKQTHGHNVLEVAWTIVPFVILLVLAIPTINTIFALESEPPTKDYMTVEVVGKQWWWEFTYPGQKIVTANELVLPAGKTVYLKIRSTDVIHSFWIPQLMGKQDAFDGRETTMWFTPTQTGQYWGQCVEYCGAQHALMRMSAIVVAPAEFDAWVARNQKPAVPTTDLAKKGEEVFSKNACLGCHTIQGTSAAGKVGPDLSHFGSRTTVGAGILPNTRENLTRWVSDPQGVKPSNHPNKMPNLNLAPDEVEAVVEYLHSLK